MVASRTGYLKDGEELGEVRSDHEVMCRRSRWGSTSRHPETPPKTSDVPGVEDLKSENPLVPAGSSGLESLGGSRWRVTYRPL